MIFDKQATIDFPKFYLIEFLRNALQKGEGTLNGDNHAVLDELSAFLVREENVIEGFEKLARHQGTNEFSIFLFDMIDHLSEYQPRDAYNRIPELANDFINLYNLMLEETECEEAINQVLNQYRQEYGKPETAEPVSEPPQVEAEEKPETATEGKPSPVEEKEPVLEVADGISFFDFYEKEFARLLYSKIREEKGEEDAARYRDLFLAFVRFNRDVDPSERSDYRNSIEQLAGLMDELFPEQQKRLPALRLMRNLEKQVKKFISQAKRFDRYNKKSFQSIIEKNEFTRKQRRADRAKEPDKKVSTIETILFDYFKTEVNHRLDEVEDQLSTLQDKQQVTGQDIDALIQSFKSLKEVSMIHGYSGMEHLSTVVIKLLTKLNKPHIDFSEESFDTIREIIDKLRDVSKFQVTDKEDKNMLEMEQKIYSIEDTVTEFIPEEEEEEEEEEEAEEGAAEKKEEAETETEDVTEEAAAEPEHEPAEGEIGFTDTKRLLTIMSDTLRTVYKKVEELHQDLSDREHQKELRAVAGRLQSQMGLVDADLRQHFFTPLNELYAAAFSNDALPEDLEKHLADIWNKGIGSVEKPDQREELDALFRSARESLAEAGVPEAGFDLSDDEKIAEAFFEAHKALWQVQKGAFTDLFIHGDKSKEGDLIRFFSSVRDNLQLTGFTNFLPFTNLFIDLIEDHGEIVFDDEIVSELDHSLRLILDRIRHKGRNGDCDDITGALKELISDVRKAAGIAEEQEEPAVEEVEEKSEEEPEKEPAFAEAEEADEEDVTVIFYAEVKEHLDKINGALETLDVNSNDRAQYTIIETAVHDIRSSAHLLNLGSVVKISALIEEIAEIYGQSDISIPDDLNINVRAAVEDLKIAISDPEADISKTIDSLQYLVDHIVIEDSLPAPEMPAKEVEKEPEKPAVEEKPLFLEAGDVDQEFLDIFRDEAGTYLKVIEAANHRLIQNLDDMDSLNEFENAAHSLKSAAKMIGFKEIGQLTDAMERISESIKNGEIANSVEIQDKLAAAIDLIKRLSQGDQVSSNELVTILNILDPRYFSKDIPSAVPEEEVTDLQADSEMTDVFLLEGTEIVQALNEDLLELEQAPASETVVTDVLRRLHTLKGSAALFNYHKIRDLTHKLEDYFQIYSEKGLDQKEEMLNPAFAAIDLIAELLNSIREGKGEFVEQFTPRMAEIDNRLFLYRNFRGMKPPQEEEKKEPPAKPAVSGKKAADDDTIIRVQTDYLDRLVDMAADLMINQTQLNTNLDTLQNISGNIESEKKRIQSITSEVEELLEKHLATTGDAEEKESLNESLKGFSDVIHRVASELSRLNQNIEYSSGRISNLSKMLHNDILKTRMIPVEKLFSRYPRAVRDMAKEQGKKITITIEGGDTEMDRAMIDALNDPVMHIIRNAVDHGLEKPAERSGANKEKTGQLILKARHDKNQVVIEIEDDGRGIDLDKVRDKIIDKNLATVADVESMSEAEILDYLFHSGFTTREKADEISGRGIGLDVVKLQIQKLKGNIRIRTEPGLGTTFSLRVPLTLLISQALLVEVHGQKIAVPLAAVQETVYFSSGEIEEEGGKKFLSVRGNYLPYVDLNELLAFNDGEVQTPAESMAVIVHDAGISMALGVDRIMDRQEIVVKSLGSHLQNVDYISGGTILGSGEVGLILDYATVIRSAEVHFFGSVRDKYVSRKTAGGPVRKASAVKKEQKTATKISRKDPGKKVVKDRKPTILIVDDSISVRNFVGSILERNHYETIKSSNGADAWERLQKGEVDLMITDLEMPEMHGFELISKIRENKAFAGLPIIILTGRAGMKDRQKGESLGANSFLVKPFKENDLLQAISGYVTHS